VAPCRRRPDRHRAGHQIADVLIGGQQRAEFTRGHEVEIEEMTAAIARRPVFELDRERLMLRDRR
jgi:hypothetical protein